jgi:hypothetical protein
MFRALQRLEGERGHDQKIISELRDSIHRVAVINVCIMILILIPTTYFFPYHGLGIYLPMRLHLIDHIWYFRGTLGPTHMAQKYKRDYRRCKRII